MDKCPYLEKDNSNNVCRTEILLQAGRPPWNENRLLIHNCLLSLIYDVFTDVLTCQSSNPKRNATLLGCSGTRPIKKSLHASAAARQGTGELSRRTSGTKKKTFVIRACELFYAWAEAKRFKCVS